MSTLDAPAAPSPAFEAFCAARDQLIALREDHARAVAEFTFPDVGDRYNWAIDWFDVIARGNDRTALVIVEDDGSSRELTFDALAARSRVACQATPVDLQATIWGVPLRRVLIWIVVVPWLTSLFLQTATGAVIQGRERAAGELAAAVSRPLIWIPIIGLASFVLATVVTNSIQMARELRSARGLCACLSGCLRSPNRCRNGRGWKFPRVESGHMGRGLALLRLLNRRHGICDIPNRFQA
jgi:hypothetical protein